MWGFDGQKIDLGIWLPFVRVRYLLKFKLGVKRWFFDN